MQAQDTLVKISGEHIPAHVLEIADTYVIYRPFTAPDSVTIMLGTQELKKIIFKNGEQELFHSPAAILNKYKISRFGNQYIYQGIPVDRKYLYRVMSIQNDPGINLNIKQARKYKTSSMILGFSGIPLFYSIYYPATLVSSKSTNTNAPVALFLLAATAVSAVEITAIILNVNHKQNLKKAVDLYNKNLME